MLVLSNMPASEKNQNIDTIIARYKKHRKWVVGLLISGIVSLFLGFVPGFLLLAGFLGELQAVNVNKRKVIKYIKNMIHAGNSRQKIIDTLVSNGLSESKSDELTDYEWMMAGRDN